ncbi:MAG: hydroxymethylglutaryl-CoA reductase, degradative [Aerococcaceae bacterium]|nr:hydroxymethylglutaryl-CoA reductase, degradative [Aerococcaceae bacterium]
MAQQFNQFYRKTPEERLEVVRNYLQVSDTPFLPKEIANQMIENYVYGYQLPLGIVPNVSVNGKLYQVPMATEEPSVIAAASNGAKRLGNMTAHTTQRELVGQIMLLANDDADKMVQAIQAEQEQLLTLARQTVPSMVKRGGGPTRLWVETKKSATQTFITVYLGLNPCDAMGANVMNTVLEALAPTLENLTHSEVLMSILSNYHDEAVTIATASVPLLDEESFSIAKKIALASQYATLDPYRATTHNKGIMNGIDAVVVATGNDWRAIEAGVHAYASRTSTYQPLTKWWVDDTKSTLEGEIVLPLAVATVGGTLSVHPTAKQSLTLLGCQSASELAQVIASIGLAQNYAALRALVTDGIQKGHMRMQARSLALQVGATIEEIPHLVRLLREQPHMNRDIAQTLLTNLRSCE